MAVATLSQAFLFKGISSTFFLKTFTVTVGVLYIPLLKDEGYCTVEFNLYLFPKELVTLSTVNNHCIKEMEIKSIYLIPQKNLI